MFIKTRTSFISKVVSLALVCAFSFCNAGYAVETGIQPPEESISGPLSVKDVGIAIDAATVKSRYQGDSGKTVVHIQDAHCNYEAQSNINRVLDQLTRECGIDMISVEGAEGLVDTAWFRAFPDAEIRREVATYFMKKGEITGAEFFSITGDYSGTIFGAETREYYIKNLRAFTDVYPYKDEIERYFTGLSSVATRLKDLVYSPRIKELDSRIRKFDSKEMELSEYADYLSGTAARNRVDISKNTNFKKLLDTLEYENKIDFDIVDQERSEYIDLLSKRLSKEAMTELVSQSIRFKKGHIKAVNFYGYLRNLAKEYDIPIIREYPNLFYYYLYTKIYDGIDNESLFRELAVIKKQLKDRLFRDETERTLDKYAEMIDMYVDLVNIELTNDDYDVFNEYSNQFSGEDILEFLAGLVARYNLNYDIAPMPARIAENLPKMVDFYEIAIKRDKALIQNTLDQMEKQDTDRCVLIAGGFHTRGIKSILEAKGISYVVVTPKITKDVETPYIKVLTNQRTSLEDIITESAAVPATGINASREEIVRPKGDMLAPPERVLWTIPMYLDDPGQLDVLSKAIGAVEGRTVRESTEETYTEMVRKLVRGWLLKAKERADSGVWDAAVRDWPLLMGAYLRKFAEAAREAGMSVGDAYSGADVAVRLNQREIEAVDGEFRAIFKGAVADFAKEEGGTGAAGAVRTSQIDDRSDIYEPLTPAEHEALNGVIAGKMRAGEYDRSYERIILGTRVTGGDPVGYDIDLFGIRGLKKAVEEHNRTPGTVNIPLDVEVHPGTGGPGSPRRNSMYMDAAVLARLSGEERIRLARHELYHILNPEVGESEACRVLEDDLMDIRKKLAEMERQRIKDREQAMIDSDPALSNKLRNIGWAGQLARTNDSVPILAVVSGSAVDRDNWQQILSAANADLFDADGSTLMLSLQEKTGEKTREGNMLGTLLAHRRIREAAAESGIPYGDCVTLVGMLFGRGERMSPITQAAGGRKPAIVVTPAIMPIGGATRGMTAIEEALVHFAPVAKYLERRGFRGIVDKWGDETELASVDLTVTPAEGESLEDHDVIKVISVIEITKDLARQKDWVVFDKEGNMLGQLPRNEISTLIGQLKERGIEPREDGKFYAGVSLGPVAVSYKVLDIAEEVFAQDIEKPGVYFDFDPYFFMALAFTGSREDWEREVQADRELAKLAGRDGMVPDFFEKVTEIKRRFFERHGRPLNLKTLDLGAAVYWADIGEHRAMRQKFQNLLEKGPEGIVARRISGLGDATPDEYGNIIINSRIDPGVTVRNSVIVNSVISGGGEIEGGVILDSQLNGIEARDAFAVRSRRLGSTVLPEKSGLFESLGAEALVLEPGQRHVSVLTSEGRKDFRVAEDTNLRDRAATYDVPILGNPLSFADLYQEMFGTGMDEIERRRAAEMERLDRIEEKMKTSSPLRFGTSGLRDSADRLTDMEVYINAIGFLMFLKARGEITEGDKIAVGGDLRSSTPRITAAIAQAVKDAGMRLDYLGEVPSPTLAYYALTRGMPSIMVTGSHIPDVTEDNPYGRNGIKFTKKSGEVLKSDESDIRAHVDRARIQEYGKDPRTSMFSEDGSFKEPRSLPEGVSNEEAVKEYIKRYVDAFGSDALAGETIAVYQHSAVGREIVPRVFEALGATVARVGFSETFIPVDTEKISPATTETLKNAAREHTPFAVISFDGDTDRPILADETGKFLPGDKLGALVSILLRPDFAAIPVSANPAVVEALQEEGIKVRQTRIGSPYVIAAMDAELQEDPSAQVAGWESNGGYLLGSDWKIDGRELSKLPTRDAVLPLIASILLAKRNGQSVSQMIEQKLPPYATAANVVDVSYPGMEGYTTEMGAEIVQRFSPGTPIVSVTFAETEVESVDGEQYDERELLRIKQALETYFTPRRGFGRIVNINFLDGIRITFDKDGKKEFYHLRPSGNAPEFRNYTAAETEARALELVELRKIIMPEIVAGITGEPSPPAAQAVRTSPALAAGTPAANIARAIESGRPYELIPYEVSKPWGIDGVGERWFGMQSSAAVGENTAPVAEIMRTHSAQVLGPGVQELYGREAMPLVKILTPRDRLSVQFHDAKNEVWIVTGIDTSAAGDRPAVILGFSPAAVERYGDSVTREYGKVLEKYGRELNGLIGALEGAGFREALERTGDAEKAALETSDQTVQDALEKYSRARERLESFYNYRPVKVGDVIPIPAGTLHALGAGIEIIEPQIPGTTQPLEDGGRYPVRYDFPGFQSQTAQRALDTERVDEIIPQVAQETPPIVISGGDGYSVERLPGSFESKGLEVRRISLDPGAAVDLSGTGSFHTLAAIGEGARVVINGQEYPIPPAGRDGRMLQIPATVGDFRVTAGPEEVQVIDTFTPIPEMFTADITVSPRMVPATDVRQVTQEVVCTIYDGAIGTFDRADFIDSMVSPPILAGREHELLVTRGTVRVEKEDGEDPIELREGEKTILPQDCGEYRVVKTSNGNAGVILRYARTTPEKAVYDTYALVRRHLEEIRKVRHIDILMPGEMFVPGGADTIGSRAWEEAQLRQINPKIRIVEYSALMGLADAANRSITPGGRAVLVATRDNIEQADRTDPRINALLKGDARSDIPGVRVLAIPDVHKEDSLEGRGWFFTREVEGTALMLASVTREDIDDKEENIAADLQRLMTQLTGTVIPRRYLYYLLPYDEIGGDLRDRLPADLREDAFGWMLFIVRKMLLKMPIRPFDPNDQLQTRRKMMWSA